MARLPRHDRLARLWARGRRFLGTELAVMGGAMTWVSERNLVTAISEAGGFGVLACGSMTPALLAAEIEATRALTGLPFGVNLIVMHPALRRAGRGLRRPAGAPCRARRRAAVARR